MPGRRGTSTTFARARIVGVALLAAGFAALAVGPPTARADGDPPAAQKAPPPKSIALAKPASRIAASPDGNRVAVLFRGGSAAIVPTDGTAPRDLDLTETLPASDPAGGPTTIHPRPLAVTFTRDGRRVVVLTEHFRASPDAVIAGDHTLRFDALVFDAATGERKHRVRLSDQEPVEEMRHDPGQMLRLGSEGDVAVALDGDRVLIDRADGSRDTVNAVSGLRQPAGESLRDAHAVAASATGRAAVIYADDLAAGSVGGVTLIEGETAVPGTRVEVRRTSDAHRLAQFPWRNTDGSLDHASRPALSEDASTVFVVVENRMARRIEARAAADGTLRWRTGDVGGSPVTLLPPRDGLVVVLGDGQLRAFAQATGTEVPIPDPECLTASAAAPTAEPRVLWVLVGDRNLARITLPAAPQ